MARALVQVLGDIRAFRPSGGDWRELDELLGELWGQGDPERAHPELLAALERFPEDDGAGILWTVVYRLESLPGYEVELVRSVQRRPSRLGIAMIGRLLNSGVSQVVGGSLVELLLLPSVRSVT